MDQYQAINGWTKQKMIKHIIKNFKGRSYDKENESCLYRGPNGTKCAVGIFIPKELDSEIGNNNDSIARDLLNNSYAIREVMPLKIEGLMSMQEAHDIGDGTSSRLDNRTDEEVLQDILSWVYNYVK